MEKFDKQSALPVSKGCKGLSRWWMCFYLYRRKFSIPYPQVSIQKCNHSPVSYHMWLFNAKQLFPLDEINSGAFGKFPISPVFDFQSNIDTHFQSNFINLKVPVIFIEVMNRLNVVIHHTCPWTSTPTLICYIFMPSFKFASPVIWVQDNVIPLNWACSILKFLELI